MTENIELEYSDVELTIRSVASDLEKIVSATKVGIPEFITIKVRIKGFSVSLDRKIFLPLDSVIWSGIDNTIAGSATFDGAGVSVGIGNEPA